MPATIEREVTTQSLMQQRRRLSDALPANTLRDDSRLDAVSELDGRIALQAHKMGINEMELWAAYDATGTA